MPSRRDLIRMTDEERTAFLKSHRTLTIVSNGANGHPHPMPMWFALDDDGSVRMSTFRKSQKVKNIERDPRVTLLCEDGTEYSELRGVVIYGRCEVVDDLRTVQDTLLDITGGEAASDQAARENMYAMVESTARKRVLLHTRPDKIVSWDHTKLEGKY